MLAWVIQITLIGVTFMSYIQGLCIPIWNEHKVTTYETVVKLHQLLFFQLGGTAYRGMIISLWSVNFIMKFKNSFPDVIRNVRQLIFACLYRIRWHSIIGKLHCKVLYIEKFVNWRFDAGINALAFKNLLISYPY
jgi:hypothetical protein